MNYRQQYDLAFQVCPIILQRGIAGSVQGGLLPITTLTGGMPATLDDAFAHYLPLPGSTLISQSIATFPFANQAVAANDTIQEPLTLSMLMIAPVNQANGYPNKLPLFTALQNALKTHNSIGGMYNVATPAMIYYNLLMVAMTDVTDELSEESKQVQFKYQLDFIQPLTTQAAASNQLSALMQKITAGNQITGPAAWSGLTALSPANLSGVTGALGNIGTSLASFGGALTGGQ